MKTIFTLWFLLIGLPGWAVSQCPGGDLNCFRERDEWFRENILFDRDDFFIHDEATVIYAISKFGDVTSDLLSPDQKERIELILSMSRRAAELEKTYFEATQGKSCAVVGSAGNLKNSSYGDIIDGHDVVFRMNDAPLKGYEKDVGTKSTFRVMTGRVVFSDRDDQVLLSKNIWAAAELFPRFIRKNRHRILMVGPTISVNAQNLFASKTHPSTGMFTLLLALQTCRSVDAFGFGPNRSGEYDYYFSPTKKFGSQNNVSEEADFLKTLEDKKVISFFHGGS